MLASRMGRRDDVETLADLWHVALTARRGALGLPLGELADEAGARRLVGARLADPSVLAVLAEEHSEPVAMALALPAPANDGASPDPIPGLVHVSMVAVLPDRWGRGLGGVVLDAALTAAQLWTHETNLRAQRLYEQRGWTTSGRKKVDDHDEPIQQYVTDL